MSIIADGVYTIIKHNGQVATVIVASAPPASSFSQWYLGVKGLGLSPEQPPTLNHVLVFISAKSWMSATGKLMFRTLLPRTYLPWISGRAWNGKALWTDQVAYRVAHPIECGIREITVSSFTTRDRTCITDIVNIVVLGGPVDGTELAFDVSPLTIFPPQVLSSIQRYCD